jgi:hypothetical protein
MFYSFSTSVILVSYQVKTRNFYLSKKVGKADRAGVCLD